MGSKLRFFFLFILIFGLVACQKAKEQTVVITTSHDLKDPVLPGNEGDESPKEKTKETPAVERGFYIQMGSFKEESNALALQANIESWGYATLTDKLQGSKGTWSIVLVGPFYEKDSALNHQKILEKRADMRGTVIKEMTR